MQALYTAIFPRGVFIFQCCAAGCCGVLRGVLVFCVNLFAVSYCGALNGETPFYV